MSSKFPSKVQIVEVGPRDGLQNEKKIVSTENKIKLINFLSDSGLESIEVTSFVSPRWVPQLSDAKEVLSGINQKPGVVYSALVPNLKGLERAIDAGVKRIAVFTAASETFNKKNINMSVEESISGFKEVCEIATKNGISMRGYISTCFVCPYEGEIDKEKVLDVSKRLQDLGVDEISIGDTIGSAKPINVNQTVSHLLTHFKVCDIALHFHDTYGNALSNVLEGLKLGVSKYDTSCGGLGGCPYAPGASGNLATEDLVSFLNENGVDSGVEISEIVKASTFIEGVIGKELPSKKLKELKSKN